MLQRTLRAMAACAVSLLIFAAPPGAVAAPKTVHVPVAIPDPMDDVYAALTAIQYVGLIRVEEAVAQLQADVGTFVADALEAEYLAAHPPAPARSVTVASAPSGGGGEVGECTGFVIPSYIIQRESGGSSTAMNPSGAYGCAQTLLSHYQPGGACYGDNPYTIQGQRDCVYTLSSGGSNLSPWAATR